MQTTLTAETAEVFAEGAEFTADAPLGKSSTVTLGIPRFQKND
jgi:hypothetical protein